MDFCLRAKAAGFKNLAALNVFVTHFGNRSFGLQKKALVAQNNKALFSRYPDYDRDYRQFLLKDPLRAHREAVSRALYTPLNGPLHLVYAWDNDSSVINSLRRHNKDQNIPWVPCSWKTWETGSWSHCRCAEKLPWKIFASPCPVSGKN